MNQYITIPLSKTGKKHSGKYEAIVDAKYSYLADENWSVYMAHGLIYAKRCAKINGKYQTIILHRVIFELEHGITLTSQQNIDHINHDGLDCRSQNLRLANESQNRANSGIMKTNTTGFIGVVPTYNGKWIAKLNVNGKQRYFGRYATKEEAAFAVDKAFKEIYGDFAPKS